jgi:transposase
MLLSEGQMSDYKGAALMIDAFPKAAALLGDKGYDADWFRTALADRGIAACIPSKANRNVPIPHDTVLYRRRHKIENMFGRLKDWRRTHTRYDRCAVCDGRGRPLIMLLSEGQMSGCRSSCGDRGASRHRSPFLITKMMPLTIRRSSTLGTP